MSDEQVVESIQEKYDSFNPYLNEKTRRIWAAIEARSLGWGGVSQVAIATGLSRTTIQAGMRWLSEKDGVKTETEITRIRQSGGGYGIYDLTFSKGWVNVGIDHDTAEFAVESIRHWWYSMGKELYPHSHHIMITADCGGSNSYRSRLWKLKLQELATETGKNLHVCHFPPGTSKWNKIEHRLFSHITNNWRGRPLTSLQVVINLIRNTTTTQGLEVKARLDKNLYKTGIKVTDTELDTIAIERNSFHGEWNYIIKPQILS